MRRPPRADVEEMRVERAAGDTLAEVGRRRGISKQAAHALLRRADEPARWHAWRSDARRIGPAPLCGSVQVCACGALRSRRTAAGAPAYSVDGRAWSPERPPHGDSPQTSPARVPCPDCGRSLLPTLTGRTRGHRCRGAP